MCPWGSHFPSELHFPHTEDGDESALKTTGSCANLSSDSHGQHCYMALCSLGNNIVNHEDNIFHALFYPVGFSSHQKGQQCGLNKEQKVQKACEKQSISRLLRNHQGLPTVCRLKLRQPALKVLLSLALSCFFPHETPFPQLWQSLNVLGHSHLCAFIPIAFFL